MATSVQELNTRKENLMREIGQLRVLRAWSHQPELFDGSIAMFQLRLDAVNEQLKERGWLPSVTQSVTQSSN
jgi:hypothetical protein